MTDDRLTHQEQVDAVVAELLANEAAIDPEIGDGPIGGTVITVLYDDQTLPAGFCTFFGQYADVRVEGVRHEEGQLELTLLV